MVYQILLPLLMVFLYFIFKIFKEPRPFLKSIKSIFFSTGALILMHALNPAIGVPMSINIANILTSGILGIPGICLITVLNVVF